MRCKLRGEGGGALPPRVCPPLSRSAHRVSRASCLLYVNLVSQVFVPYCARSVDLPDRGLGATKTLGTREFTRLSARLPTTSSPGSSCLKNIGARLRLPRVNKRTDMKRWNNKHVHHKIFMEIRWFRVIYNLTLCKVCTFSHRHPHAPWINTT